MKMGSVMPIETIFMVKMGFQDNIAPQNHSADKQQMLVILRVKIAPIFLNISSVST